jgi:hypothetical protein
VYTFDSLHWSMHLRLSSGTLSKHWYDPSKQFLLVGRGRALLNIWIARCYTSSDYGNWYWIYFFGVIDMWICKRTTHCLTWQVSTSQADLHSGVEGGAASEPLIDMIKILSKLVSDDNKVQIPGML